jgi:hypothetical protein
MLKINTDKNDTEESKSASGGPKTPYSRSSCSEGSRSISTPSKEPSSPLKKEL